MLYFYTTRRRWSWSDRMTCSRWSRTAPTGEPATSSSGGHQVIRYKEKPLYLLRICRLTQVLTPDVGGKIFTFAIHFPISLILCVGSPSDYFIQLNSCLPEQLFTWTAFYPVSGLTMKRTAVSQTAYYPVTLFLVHIFIIFICMFTMLILILPKIMSFILLNPQGGCRGWFFF